LKSLRVNRSHNRPRTGFFRDARAALLSFPVFA
jgi:hypothetical protein